MRRLEVTHHPACEAHLLPENLAEQVRVLAGVDAVDLVIRSHRRTNLTILRRYRERKRVDLLQRALIELRIDLETVLLLRVHIVVLGGGHDVAALDTLDGAYGYPPLQDWFL